MKYLLSFVFLLSAGCTTFQKEANKSPVNRANASIENPDTDNSQSGVNSPSVGDLIVTEGNKFYGNPYIGRIVAINEGEYCLHNGAQDGQYCQIRTKLPVYKEVPCANSHLCSKKDSIEGSSGKEFYVAHIFANGFVIADQGNPNWKSSPSASDLFNSCKAIGDLSVNKKIITPSGKKLAIYKIYQNGMLRVTDNSTIPSRDSIATFEDLGFSGCSNEKPCPCSK